jgi:iron(III) transport system ATP-binding protein
MVPATGGVPRASGRKLGYLVLPEFRSRKTIMSTTITLKQLTKQFPGSVPGAGGVATTAVDHVDLTINSGELFFLLGPSGCGKTTLLRMIAGFIEPTSGQVLFKTDRGERDVTYLPPNKRNTGMVFQSYALWPHMTVAKNVAFGLSVRKVSKDETERRVREALDVVQMGKYADRKPNQLSGGQQQRVALARALVIRPDVLLLDEPLSNLDAKLRIELRSEIRKICKQAKMTAIYVTHDQKEALSMADRVAIVSGGRVVQVGEPADLYRKAHTRFVAEFLGETNLFAGDILERTPERVVVQTSAGPLVSTTVSPLLELDARRALVSVRPEAFRIGESIGSNNLPARVSESTYLGETAQLEVELPGGARASVAALNPGVASRVGERLPLSIATDDVVALPE